MEIIGKITGIEYKIELSKTLKRVAIKDFDINKAPATCLVESKKGTFAISKWVSPKRTRSYPYERVYNSLSISKKITVIPIVKDEGAVGDRDFLQWDTVSMMSLLDVFVIFAYYHKAKASSSYKGKITNQQLDNDYILEKIREIEQYHSSALHWNLNELTQNFYSIIDKAKTAYISIEQSTGIALHNVAGLDSFKDKIGTDVSSFMEFSRQKAKEAQRRESATLQPKERLGDFSKAKVTITNYLGGKYFFTVDEVTFSENTIFLTECKHSKKGILPSMSDIKDGLIKMILYTNLKEVAINDVPAQSKAVLKLTSEQLKGKRITSEGTEKELDSFCRENVIGATLQKRIELLFKEAKENNFIVSIEGSI